MRYIIRNMSFLKEKIQIIIVLLLTLPWILSLALKITYLPHLQAFLSGIAIIAAAFLISWAAETAEIDLPRSFSLALVALLVVLPEYAVDAYFAWVAGKIGGEYIHYTTANMTGANRLLIGIGWSSLAMFAMFKKRKKLIILDQGIYLESFVLLIATIYAFTIPVRSEISYVDSIFFIALYFFYLFLAIKSKGEEFEMLGVARYLSKFSGNLRHFLLFIMFTYAGFVIFVSVGGFSEGLIHTAKKFGLDEYLIVQWIAPIASEAPELVVGMYFVNRLRVTAGINSLISAKVNQWTLLIGTISLVYSLSIFRISALPLDTRQAEEIFLTAAQSLFALSILLNLRLTFIEAISLLALFLVQLIFPGVLVRYVISLLYIFLSIPLFIVRFSNIKRSLSYVISLAK